MRRAADSGRQKGVKQMGDKLSSVFVTAIENGGLMQSALTLVFGGAWLLMVFQGKPPPTMLENIVSLVVGFWMGGSVQGKVNAQLKSLLSKEV